MFCATIKLDTEGRIMRKNFDISDKIGMKYFHDY